MQRYDLQLRRVALIGTLIGMLTGGMLLAVPALLARGPAPAAQPSVISHSTTSVAAPPAPPAPPLPTIGQPTPVPTTPPATSDQSAVVPIGQASAEPALSLDAGAEHAVHGADLAARLAEQLACVQPGVRHDATLDAQAARAAQQEPAALPPTGAIHIHGSDSQQLLLAADSVAELRAQGGRCGETLIFGVPPLEWLPKGTRFGVGVDVRAHGAVATILTR